MPQGIQPLKKSAGEGIGIVGEDPKISEAIEKLNGLEFFIRQMQEKSEDFLNYYEGKYDHRLNFTSKRFWDAHLY